MTVEAKYLGERHVAGSVRHAYRISGLLSYRPFTVYVSAYGHTVTYRRTSPAAVALSDNLDGARGAIAAAIAPTFVFGHAPLDTIPFVGV